MTNNATKTTNHETINHNLEHEPNPLDKVADEIEKRVEEQEAILRKEERENEAIRQFKRNQTFNIFFEGAKESFCHNMGWNRIDKKISMSEISRKSGIPIEKLELYQLGLCEFDFEDICKIAFALDMRIEKIFGE